MSDKAANQAKEGGAKIPRIPFDDFASGFKESLRPKVERLGYCGEIRQAGVNVPKSMLSFCTITEDLEDEMPMKVVELVALTVAGVMDDTCARNRHENLADKLGYGRDWIAAVNALKADEAEALSPDERKMRSAYGLPQKTLTDALRYHDPKYYDMALR